MGLYVDCLNTFLTYWFIFYLVIKILGISLNSAEWVFKQLSIKDFMSWVECKLKIVGFCKILKFSFKFEKSYKVVGLSKLFKKYFPRKVWMSSSSIHGAWLDYRHNCTIFAMNRCWSVNSLITLVILQKKHN